MDTPRGRRPDPFHSLEQLPRPDLWDEICQRAQERTRVHVALHAPRRAHPFASRGALTVALAAVALIGGFAAGRHGARPSAAPAAAPVIIRVHDPEPARVSGPALTVAAPAAAPVAAPATGAAARCLPDDSDTREPRGVR